MSEQPRAEFLGKGHLCRGCSYDLEGLPASGRCPECGRWYPPFAGDEYDVAAWDIARRMTWPIPLLLLIPVLSNFGDHSPEAVQVVAGFSMVAIAVVSLGNCPLQVYVLLRWNRQQGRRPRRLIGSLSQGGKVVVAISLLVALVPWAILVWAIPLWM